MNSTADQIARLIVKHVDRELVGGVWRRVSRLAEAGKVNLSFIRHAERLERIDDWRKWTGCRPAHRIVGRVVSIPMDSPPVVHAYDPTAEAPNGRNIGAVEIAQQIIRTLPARHRHITVECMIRGRPQIDVADEMGIKQSRVTQLKTEAISWMRLVADVRFPELRKEICG